MSHDPDEYEIHCSWKVIGAGELVMIISPTG
jgi:hypothetical protein